MIDNLKKNWFVVLIAIALVTVIGSYGVTQIQSVFKGKTVDGKQVAFEVAGKDIFADEYYTMLDESRGDNDLFRLFKRQMLSHLETSEELATKAKTSADTARKNAASQGQASLDQLGAWLVSQGYTGLDELATYFEDTYKQESIIKDYFVANYDTIFKKKFEEAQTRSVSHILIKMKDPKNPTEQELLKVSEVEKLLAEGKGFDEVALQKSEDTESAAKRGSLGVVDKDTSFVTEFKNAMLSLKDGEVSGWVTSEYGQHLIKVDSTDFKTLLDNEEYFETLMTDNSTDAARALWEKGQTLKIEFNDASVEKRLLQYLGLESEEN